MRNVRKPLKTGRLEAPLESRAVKFSARMLEISAKNTPRRCAAPLSRRDFFGLRRVNSPLERGAERSEAGCVGQPSSRGENLTALPRGGERTHPAVSQLFSQHGCYLTALRFAWYALLFSLGVGCAGEPRSEESSREEILVFAAASLTDALETLADSFETAHPQYRVVLNVAATSLLARQIEQGAPADVFFSANLAWMQRLEQQGRIEGTARQPLGNRLVVVGRAERAPWSSLEPLLTLPRIALADPDHVPAGIYARQGLECAGLWEEVLPRLVPTLDVRAALLSVRHGATDVALVYASDVQADPNVRVLLTWPSACQPEIRYAVARLRGAANPEGADRLLAFVTDSARTALWERFGFLPR